MTTDISTAPGCDPVRRISRREAAARLGVHEQTIDRYVRDGVLPAYRTTVGRRTYLDPAHVERVRRLREGLDT